MLTSSSAWMDDIASAAKWRQPQQLRGLQTMTQSYLLSDSAPLAKAGTPMVSESLSLHSSEEALAVGLNPLGSVGSVGIFALRHSNDDTASAPSLDNASLACWIDLPEDHLCCVEWAEDVMLVGSTRGRVLVGNVPLQEASSSSSSAGGMTFPTAAVLQASESGVEMKISEVVTSPSGAVASTTVRCVHSAREQGPMLVCGAFQSSLVVWDLQNNQATPAYSIRPSCTPSSSSASNFSPVVCASWAPMSNGNVLMSGCWDGSAVLVDRRCDRDGKPSRFVMSPSSGCCNRSPVRAMSMHEALPWMLATCCVDDTLRVFDVRFTQNAVFTRPAGQGGLTGAAWLPSHSDLLATAGADGTVKLWGLRCSPTFCVGRWSHRMPLGDLVSTSRYSEPRLIGVTLDGELTMCGLHTDGMAALAPTSLPRSLLTTSYSSAAAGAGGKTTTQTITVPFTEDEEARIKKVMAASYTRNPREACTIVADSVQRAVASQRHDQALVMVELISPLATHPFALDASLESLRDGTTTSAKLQSLLSFAQCQELFTRDVEEYSCRIPSTIDTPHLFGVSRVEKSVSERLEALKQNIGVQRSLAAKDVASLVELLRGQAASIKQSPSAVELVSAETVCSVVKWLSSDRVSDAITVVEALLDALILPDGTTPSKPLFRRVVIAALSPLITDELEGAATTARPNKQRGGDGHDEDEDGDGGGEGLSDRERQLQMKLQLQKRNRKYMDRCLKDLRAAKDAVVTQLKVRQLGVTKPADIVTLVTTYQQQAIEHNQSGIFSWLSASALLLYLNSLCTTSAASLAVFLWTSVQLVDHLRGLPMVHEVESMLLNTLDRLRSTSQHLQGELESCCQLHEKGVVTSATIRTTEPILRRAHVFLEALLRLQLECEGVADESEAEVPHLMESTMELLSNCITDLLEIWAGVLDVVSSSGSDTRLKETIKAPGGILDLVKQFTKVIGSLIEMSSMGEEDHMLVNTRDACDDFVESLVTTTTRR